MLTRRETADALGLTLAQVRHAEQTALEKLRSGFSEHGIGDDSSEPLISALVAMLQAGAALEQPPE